MFLLQALWHAKAFGKALKESTPPYFTMGTPISPYLAYNLTFSLLELFDESVNSFFGPLLLLITLLPA